MHNYIVINGKSSDLINGLLIQNLPPITKPQQRAQVEEIDGRDGDLIDFLGYAAYDKSFDVGLYGNYCINKILDYFNMSGMVTFSNEPDKFYRFTSLSQIDFNRLLRFKTATVTMHVQPFKYSLVDKLKSFTISSNPATVEIRNNGNFYALPTLKIFGSGIVTVALNAVTVFTINLASDEYIVLDCQILEAYKGATLKNRSVLGNYDNFKLQPGVNYVTFTGSVSQVEFTNFSRWI